MTLDYGPAKLDVYVPPGAIGLPVVLFVHGGAWRTGSRSHVQSKPEFFCGNGFVFVSTDYRMLPDADVATQANDVERAYAYVRENIGRHGGDPDRIAVMGHSAGCHLAALAGLRGGLPDVKALVLNDTGAYDLEALFAAGGERRLHREVFPDPGQWRALSPITYAGSRPHPPVLIAYSRVPGHAAAADRFAERLRAAGTEVVLFDGSAYTHLGINRRIGADQGGISAAVLSFLRASL